LLRLGVAAEFPRNLYLIAEIVKRCGITLGMSTLGTTPSPFLTVAETAEILRVSLRTAYALAERGDIPSVRVGGQWRIPRVELQQRLSITQDAPAP
jgi:excisionase family DNA binding protein